MNWLLILIPLLVLFPRKGNENMADSLVQNEVVVFPEIDEQLRQCFELRYTDPESAMEFCRNALELSSEKGYEEGRIKSHLLMGILNDVSSNYERAIHHYRTSLSLSQDAGDTLRVAVNNANIGLTFFHMGNFREAMEYFLNSLDYFEQVNFSTGIASTFNNIGMIYSELENYEKALEQNYKALEIRQQIDDKNGIGASLTNIGNLYNKIDSLEKSIDYINRSIAIKDSINDFYGLTVSYTILGGIYIKQDKLEEGDEILQKAISLSKEIESPGQEINAYLVYHNLLLKRGMFNDLIKLNLKALEMGKEIGSLKYQSSAYKNLSLAYDSLGNKERSFQYYRMHIQKKDELMSRDRINQVFQLELEHERQKKTTEIALLNRQAEISKLQIEKQQLLLSRRKSTIVAIITFFFITLLFIYHRYTLQKNREKIKLNKAFSQVQKQVARGAIEAEIKERQRIGEELHDSFGQVLSLIKLNLTKVQKMKDAPEQLREEMMNNTVSLANKAFVDLRDISHNMSPIMLKTKGLVLSVRDLLDRIEETNLYNINYDVIDMEGKLEPFIEFTLFRTIQELLNNILNHAQATEISVQILKDGGEITIMVEDNGVGFDEKGLDKVDGMGLRNTFSRIRNLNGEMIIDSAIDRGTIITIIVPVDLNN